MISVTGEYTMTGSEFIELLAGLASARSRLMQAHAMGIMAHDSVPAEKRERFGKEAESLLREAAAIGKVFDQYANTAAKAPGFLVTVEDAARILCVDDAAVRSLIEKGKFTHAHTSAGECAVPFSEVVKHNNNIMQAAEGLSGILSMLNKIVN